MLDNMLKGVLQIGKAVTESTVRVVGAVGTEVLAVGGEALGGRETARAIRKAGQGLTELTTEVSGLAFSVVTPVASGMARSLESTAQAGVQVVQGTATALTASGSHARQAGIQQAVDGAVTIATKVAVGAAVGYVGGELVEAIVEGGIGDTLGLDDVTHGVNGHVVSGHMREGSWVEPYWRGAHVAADPGEAFLRDTLLGGESVPAVDLGAMGAAVGAGVGGLVSIPEAKQVVLGITQAGAPQPGIASPPRAAFEVDAFEARIVATMDLPDELFAPLAAASRILIENQLSILELKHGLYEITQPDMVPVVETQIDRVARLLVSFGKRCDRLPER